MNYHFIILFMLMFALITSGCTGSTQAPAGSGAPVVTATPAVPDMTGTWTGPSEGYDEGTGFSDYHDLGIAMVVTEQKGRIFAGHINFTVNGTVSSTEFAGAVGRDGRSFTISEKAGGYCLGEITGADEIEMTYMEDGSPYSIAIDSFTRVKGQ